MYQKHYWRTSAIVAFSLELSSFSRSLLLELVTKHTSMWWTSDLTEEHASRLSPAKTATYLQIVDSDGHGGVLTGCEFFGWVKKLQITSNLRAGYGICYEQCWGVGLYIFWFGHQLEDLHEDEAKYQLQQPHREMINFPGGWSEVRITQMAQNADCRTTRTTWHNWKGSGIERDCGSSQAS